MLRENITHADKFFNYMRICTRCSVTAYVTTKGVTMSSRHISSSNNLQPHQQRCVNIICKQKTKNNLNTYLRSVRSPKIPHVNISHTDKNINCINSQTHYTYVFDFVVITTYSHR